MSDFATEVARSMSLARASSPERCGTLVRLVGLRMEARGIMAPVGSSCEIIGQDGHRIEAEVVGFNGELKFDSSFPDGTPRKLLDTTKLTSLGWQPRITLQAGLAATWKSISNIL